MYPMLMRHDMPATTPLGKILPLLFALYPMMPAKPRQVARERRVPTLQAGFPMREADIRSNTVTPVETRRLVVLAFRMYALSPEPKIANAKR